MLQKISLLIILYNKNPGDSETLRSLSQFDNKIDNILIVNNGPNEINLYDGLIENLKEIHCNVDVISYLNNRPLSWIYNEFIEKYDSDFYVFFDDDTTINKDYEKRLFALDDNIDLEMPKIIANDEKQYYPILNGKIYIGKGNIENYKSIFSIGSGLILSKKIVEKIKSSLGEVFDSRFALYGVDISVFRKINQLREKGVIFKISSSTYLIHSLSRTEGEMSEWRKIERLYDEVLSVKYYTNYKILRIMKINLKNICHFRRFFILWNTWFTGVHPRAKIGKKKQCH